MFSEQGQGKNKQMFVVNKVNLVNVNCLTIINIIWCWRRVKRIKWSEKVTDEQVLERTGEKRTALVVILCRITIGLVIF